MTLMQRLADEVLARGTFSTLEGILSHAGMNELMIGMNSRVQG
jgi:hypothetical protein